MATFFVNASWNKTDDFTLTWNKHLYTPEWYDPETEAQKIVDGEPTLVYSTDKDASYYAKDLQAAINFAHPGDTIVFYNINGGSDQSDFKFYDPRGTLIVDKNLTFRTGSTTETSKDFYYGKAVKFDSLKVQTGSTLTLGKGLFSLDDVLIIDKTATLELVNNSHCNADIIQNAESGTILVDTSSRLVAASIDEGNVKIKTGEVAGEKLKWIDHPVVANIGKDVQLFFVYPGNTDGTLLNLTDSSEYKHIYVAKKKTAATSELLSVYYYTDGDDGNPQTPDAVKNHPDDYAVYDFRPTTEYESLFLINNVFDLNNPVNGTYSTAAMYVNKDWTTLPTGSFTAKRQELGGSGTVNISTTFTDPTNNSSVNITQNSIVAALNSAYVTTHTIGKDNEGVIIRVQKTENDYEELGTLSVITRNVILEPDKYWDATNGKWVYDDVSVHFGHEVNGEWTGGDLVVEHVQNLFTIKHLNTLDIRDWVIGGVNEQNGVMSFVDIGNLVIHYRLKAEYGATVLIDNCTVHSKRHFSIVGGTMIVKNSTVYLDKGYTNSSVGWGGVVSTENSTLGSGSFILHNSNFIVKQGNTSEYSVNLKDDAEFIISGKCLVNGTFTDLKGVSDTHITFRDAVLAPVVIVNPETGNPETVYSEIRPQDSLPGRGANLHFEGNNTLDHATVAQTGGQDMVIDAGATLDLSNGAAITLPNYGSNISEITNNGIVSLSNGSSITGGTITNAPDSTMTVDGTSQLYTDHFENGEGAIFTIALNPDGTLPIRPVTQNGSVTIDNQGTIVMDAGGLDYTPNNIPLEGINGNGEVVLKVQGGGIDIKTDEEGNQYIQMARPDVSTIYVNRAWSDKATGQNVGLFTYYGYNAFSDNGNPNFSRDPMWSVLKAGSTKRIIYTGADDKYGDLNLSLATAEHGVTVRTVANGAKNDAKFGTLTVGPSTPVMLSGATVDADAISVQKNGELYVTPGESAKLQLTVAEGDEPRDVQIQVINNGTKETETFTVRVPAGETVVSLSSNKFVVGQSYYVVVTDKSVNTAVHDTSEGTRKITINVAFVEEAKRTVDVTVRGVDTENKNALYTFRNVEIAKQVTSVPLSPSFGGGSEVVSVKMDDGTVVPVSDYSLVYDGGVLTLTVNRPAADPEHPEITSRRFTANIANDDNSQFLAYTFEVAVGTGDETVTLPTSFIENTEYYVMVEGPMITATAVTDSLDRSDVTTDAIVNNGRLQVASENDTRKITLTGAAGKARTVHVVVTADDFVMQTDVLIPLNDSPVPVNIYSDDFVAGVEYAIEITDAGDLLPMQTSVAEDVRRKAAMLTLTGLDVDSASSRKITVQVGGKTYTTFVPAGSAVAKLASEDFKVGKTYTGVTVTDGETTKTYASLKAETL
ncbi:MAG: hypothetical protein IJT68_06350, partial [Lentisphaeria bacterium]|nr:hypothetical protein [Lentisphaeria bacterium]